MVMRRPALAAACLVLGISAAAMGGANTAADGTPPLHSATLVAPARGVSAELDGVTAVSPSDVWAVGSRQVGSNDHFNGTRWRWVGRPGGISGLSSVSAVSRDDIWAVGVDAHQTLAEHWDGHEWSISYAVNPLDENGFRGVSAIASDDVWAVGAATVDPVTIQLIEHWNGSTWTVMPALSPNLEFGSALTDISAVSSDDIWAVGFYREGSLDADFHLLAEHWDGRVWTQVRVPPPPRQGRYDQLTGVTAISSDDVWAVGTAGWLGKVEDTRYEGFVEHWDGHDWQVVSTPHLKWFNYFTGIDASSPTDIWAVGYRLKKVHAPSHTLVEHWDGSTWSVVPSPNPGHGGVERLNQLNGVTALSATDAWAVGDTESEQEAEKQIILHWDGTTWRTDGNGAGR